MSASELRLARERACGALLARGWMVATAESCTGGLIAQQLTEIGGSSVWFERGFVTYSNAAKIDSLGVRAETLAEHGAVSAQTVEEMAAGALAHSVADVTVAVSGVAGPSGGSPDKPVGTVWFGFAVRDGQTESVLQHFEGDRAAVRAAAAAFALRRLAELASEPPGDFA